ncbi:MAG: hypothetical protein CMJ18_04695 [Phycisphaeraceae bacterium]|nr:hypothetical protein [Phycisphaeraceae bacterium]
MRARTHLSSLRKGLSWFGAALVIMIAPGIADALILGPGDVAVVADGTGSSINVNPGAGQIALNATGATGVDIDIDFSDLIVLGDPGFGPPPFPGFPPPANPWEVTMTFNTTGDNPGVTWPLGDDDLIFTGLDGGAPDVEVAALWIAVQSAVLAGGQLTYNFDISQAAPGLAVGLGFSDFHVRDIQFNLGDNATLELQRVHITPSTHVPSPNNDVIPEPLTATLGLIGLGALGGATRRRRVT